MEDGECERARGWMKGARKGPSGRARVTLPRLFNVGGLTSRFAELCRLLMKSSGSLIGFSERWRRRWKNQGVRGRSRVLLLTLRARPRIFFVVDESPAWESPPTTHKAASQETEYYTVEMLTSSELDLHRQGYLLAAASFAKFMQAVNCTRYIVPSPLEHDIVQSCPRNFCDVIDFFRRIHREFVRKEVVLSKKSKRNRFFFPVYVTYQSYFIHIFFSE